jgi:hypothetical protein
MWYVHGTFPTIAGNPIQWLKRDLLGLKQGRFPWYKWKKCQTFNIVYVINKSNGN